MEYQRQRQIYLDYREFRDWLDKNGSTLFLEFRHSRYFSQSTLAKILGVDYTYVSKVEKGKVAMSPAIFLKLCELLDAGQ